MPLTLFLLSPGIVPQCFLRLVLHILDNCHLEKEWEAYLIIVIFFTLTQFLENKIYTQETRKLRQNTQ